VELYLVSKRENTLLRRKEVYFKIKYNGSTPSRKEIREKIAGLLNADLDRIIVDFIKPEFGKTEAHCYAKIYNTPEDLRAIESKHMIRKNFGEEGNGKESKGE